MKKTILLTLLATLLAGAATAQNPLRASSVLTSAAAVTPGDTRILMNEKGVDHIMLNHKMVPETQKGTFYDRLEKSRITDNGLIVYNILLKDRNVGQIAVQDGLTAAIVVNSRQVSLENDIRIEMPFAKILYFEEVQAIVTYNYEESDYEISVSWHGIEIQGLDFSMLKESGQNKIKELVEAAEKSDPFENGETPMVNLEPDDVLDEAVVTGFAIGIRF